MNFCYLETKYAHRAKVSFYIKSEAIPVNLLD